MNIKNAVLESRSFENLTLVGRAYSRAALIWVLIRNPKSTIRNWTRGKTVDRQGNSDFPSDRGQNMTGQTVDRSGNSGFAIRNSGRQPPTTPQMRRRAQALSRISPYFVPFAVKNSGQNCSELCPETFHSFQACDYEVLCDISPEYFISFHHLPKPAP
jgi:hypothetical protein